MPSVLYQQQDEARLLTIGSYIQLGKDRIKDQTTMYFGVWHRWRDAFIFSFKLAYKAFSITLSYEANTSTLSEVSRGFGALEIGVQYHIDNKRKNKGAKYYQCPMF